MGHIPLKATVPPSVRHASRRLLTDGCSGQVTSLSLSLSLSQLLSLCLCLSLSTVSLSASVSASVSVCLSLPPAVAHPVHQETVTCVPQRSPLMSSPSPAASLSPWQLSSHRSVHGQCHALPCTAFLGVPGPFSSCIQP